MSKGGVHKLQIFVEENYKDFSQKCSAPEKFMWKIPYKNLDLQGGNREPPPHSAPVSPFKIQIVV